MRSDGDSVSVSRDYELVLMLPHHRKMYSGLCMTLPNLFKITLLNWSARSVKAHSLTEQLILATCQTSHWLTKIVGEDNSQCQQGGTEAKP
jgi:hypothetical protein